jgi:hypothetical protein
MEKLSKVYLRDLGYRPRRPITQLCAPTEEILTKLAALGAELEIFEAQHSILHRFKQPDIGFEKPLTVCQISFDKPKNRNAT